VTAAVLAVDGGNSKTDVALVGVDGRLLGYSRGPGSCHQVIGVEATMAVLSDLIRRTAVEAGLDPDAPVAERGGFYLAGADLPVEIDMLRSRIAATGWAGEVVVENDTFALLRAGTESPDRVAVVCGAGINCVGVSADGGVVRFPSLGSLSGDWGGGGQLGMEALWAAVRAEDGRGAATALRDAVPRHFGLATVAEVSAAFHLGELPRQRLHELTPVLFATAGEGDEMARALVLRMADEVVVLATVALRGLGLLDRPAELVLGGGVLASRDPLLLGAVEKRVLERAPQVVIRVVDLPPVVGAALLVLDELGAPRPVEERLRDALLAKIQVA
jgi:N-acetylglucosamine kinase-like BadF-type ATPase